MLWQQKPLLPPIVVGPPARQTLLQAQKLQQLL
jgi:hypothetical protein